MKRQWWWATAALEKQGIVMKSKNDLRIDLNPEKETLSRENHTDWPIGIGLLFFVGLCWLWTLYVRDYNYYRFINEVNIGIHEIGHLVFSVFWSQAIHVLWGTLLQLLFPVLFFVILWRKKNYFIAMLCVARFATNLFNISWYMYDATRLALPMLSMSWDIETTIHDRNYLFDLRWVIGYTDQISLVTRMIGYIFYALALFWLWYLLVQARKEKQDIGE